jgi:hypothetical protein
MRTYDDTFSGQKIYPGKVRFAVSHTDPPAVDIPRSQYQHRLHLAEGLQ